MKQVTAYVDDTEHREITRIAEAYGMSRAQIARTALRYLIRMHRKGEPIFFPMDMSDSAAESGGSE